MEWSKWVRQTHRWLSIVFTLTVIATALGVHAFWPMGFVVLPLAMPITAVIALAIDWMFYRPLRARGAKPVTMSDSDGSIYDPAGIDTEKLAWVMDLKNVRRGRLKEYADKFRAITRWGDLNKVLAGIDAALAADASSTLQT